MNVPEAADDNNDDIAEQVRTNKVVVNPCSLHTMKYYSVFILQLHPFPPNCTSSHNTTGVRHVDEPRNLGGFYQNLYS